MPLLYEPNTGMAYEVPISEIENFLRKGFRSVPPFVAETSAIAIVENSKQTVIALSSPENPNGVKVNSATLKDLAALPLVGTAIAKQMRDHRPYGSVEDLIAKIPDVDWMTINPKLNYEIENPDAVDRPE
jgi:DNA uptake protein ComE-like DNA-binding protein